MPHHRNQEPHQAHESHELPFHRKLADANPYEPIRPDPNHLLRLHLHWGLPYAPENTLFYVFAIPSWILEIAAAVTGSVKKTPSAAFIGCVTAFLVLHWAAWLQTVFGMVQRASWRRSEESVEERVQFLWLAVRLQRLMLPTAIIALATFIPAYVQRDSEDDLAYWLLFLLFFIINTVCSVMNAYNNITWEADRLWFEDRIPGVPSAHYAIFGL
nr:hypothetical protein B0A51_02273 [Rachicladosporium sp. CCFEE 5018]